MVCPRSMQLKQKDDFKKEVTIQLRLLNANCSAILLKKYSNKRSNGYSFNNKFILPENPDIPIGSHNM